MKGFLLGIFAVLLMIYEFALQLVPFAAIIYTLVCLFAQRIFPDIANIIVLVYGGSVFGKFLMTYATAKIRGTY